MYGVHWTLERRRKVAAVEGPATSTDSSVDENPPSGEQT